MGCGHYHYLSNKLTHLIDINTLELEPYSEITTTPVTAAPNQVGVADTITSAT